MKRQASVKTSQKGKESRKLNNRQVNVVLSVMIAVAVGVSGYLLINTEAAGFFASTEPENGTLSGNAKTVNDTSAYGGKAIQFTAPVSTPEPTPPPPTSTTKCPLPKYPNPSCTGILSTPTTVVSGNYTAKANEVVSNKRITGSLSIGGSGVIIRNTEIYKGINYTTNSFIIEDSTIGPASGCLNNTEGVIGTANFTMKRVRMRNISEGVRISGSNVIIQDSYFTHCEAQGVDDPHSDGIQAYGAASAKNVIISHNTIDMRTVPSATAPIFLPTDRDNQGNNGISYSVTDNVVAGGGYSIQLPGTKMTINALSGNKVVNNTWGYAPFDVSCSIVKSGGGNAVVTYDWTTGTILSQVKSAGC